ncbi:putative Mannosyl-oligosaccharide 12-alpha-mannosidase MNS1 [Paratrimastix pyriformis]|uniref:alpha-1,2-Mannosidase n=1 Tax=Paratrimastix pyriformis TaxID=342808 RepID=A0ABQ8UN36_9EUKA|nr:putative Mannosyl-oligosaccharide 12-alpha-mannosidase MNS1 [Paratrimastix pyriformis]
MPFSRSKPVTYSLLIIFFFFCLWVFSIDRGTLPPQSETQQISSKKAPPTLPPPRFPRNPASIPVAQPPPPSTEDDRKPPPSPPPPPPSTEDHPPPPLREPTPDQGDHPAPSPPVVVVDPVPVPDEPMPEPPPPEPVHENFDPTGIWKQRQLAVKDAMNFAWQGYRKYAWGADELKPDAYVSTFETTIRIVGGLLSAYDLSGDKIFLDKAKWYYVSWYYVSWYYMSWYYMSWYYVSWYYVSWYYVSVVDVVFYVMVYVMVYVVVCVSPSFDKDAFVSTFETTIRIVGGLLSAYDLSGDKVFLDKAKDLGDRLLWAFNSSLSIPLSSINLKTHQSRNPSWNGGASVLAELALQVEYRALAKRTGNEWWAQKPNEAVRRILAHPGDPHGLYPVFINPHNGHAANNLVTFGAMGDSFYEYLLKGHLLVGKKDPENYKAYLVAMRSTIESVLSQANQVQSLVRPLVTFWYVPWYVPW